MLRVGGVTINKIVLDPSGYPADPRWKESIMGNISRFEGYIIYCPHCGYSELVSDEDITFDPREDREFFVKCEKCKEEIELFLD